MEKKMSRVKQETKAFRILKALGCLIVCAIAATTIQGCWEPEGVTTRRLGARWNALNISQSAQSVGRVPEDWTAGAFISTSVLENFANLADNTEILYTGNDNLLKGTKITLQKFHFKSAVGEMLVNIDANIVGPHSFEKMNISIHGNLRFVGTTALNATTNEVEFRVEPTDIQDRDHGFLALFFSERHKYLTRLLADIALEKVAETKLLIKIPMPETLKYDAKINTTLTDTPIASATATLNLSMPNTTITEPFPYAAMLPRKDGIWVVAGQSPKITSAYTGPEKSIDREMNDVLAYLKETKSPLASLPLPPSRRALEDTLATLESNLSTSYATSPSDEINPGKPSSDQPSAIYAFVSGRTIENALNEFEIKPIAERTVTISSTATSGHLKEAAILKDDHLGDYQIYAELKGPDAIQGKVFLNLQNTKWTKSGLDGKVIYGALAKINTHLQIELGVLDNLPLLGNLTKDITGTDVTVLGDSMKSDPVPFSLKADLVQMGGASAVVLVPRISCQILNFELKTAADLGVTIHQPSIHEQPAPIPIVKSQEFFLPISVPVDGPNPTWTVIQEVKSADVSLAPKASIATDDGLFVEAIMIVTPLKAEPNSAVEAELKSEINSRNAVNAQLIAQASLAEQAASTCELTRSFAIDLGPIDIETKTFLKTLEDVIDAAKKIIGDTKKVAEDAALKLKEADAAVALAVKSGDKDAEKAARDVRVTAQAALDVANKKIAEVQQSLHGVENTRNNVVNGAAHIFKKVF